MSSSAACRSRPCSAAELSCLPRAARGSDLRRRRLRSASPCAGSTTSSPHAWRSSRLTKYLALCKFFNLSSAIIVAAVYNLAWFLYVIHFATSGVQDVRHDFVDGTPHTTPRLLRYAVAAGPVIVLLCAALLQHVLHRGATGFLDIACVPQDDEVGKAQGITRLGAVLARSERMILLVDEHYWRRLGVSSR